ncbi:YciI family protein [Labrys monachus]|uniref:Uncharacterized protein YciI n=1 Tax=Labrys monachus TaxID=217067 RepID=A0ABU0FKR7_9HYPH|nr:YciI family protein [Labrys monachus]MDQ0394635.1 uncharacterized protein YciI [Labrys monachus]
MLFVVLFEDEVSRGEEIRRRHMKAHMDFLERNASTIKAAGPLLEGDGTPAGGLWVVQAADREHVESLIREDPFWPTGLRRSRRILAWTQVFADGLRDGAQA